MFRSRTGGFTLIEMMIVVTIVGLIAVLGANIMSGTFRSKSRELQWRMASTIRYLYNSAVTESKTMRLVLDLQEGGSYWAEATGDKFLLESSEDIKERERKKDFGDDSAAPAKTEQSASTMSDETKDALGLTGDESFKQEAEEIVEPSEAVFGSVESPVLEVKQLPRGIYIKDVYTEHDGETGVSEGKAYIYFFPNGYAEPSVINFRNEDDTRQFSIKIDPYSGEVDISPEYRTLETSKK